MRLITLLLSIFLFSCSGDNNLQKTDLELQGLKGNVKSFKEAPFASLPSNVNLDDANYTLVEFDKKGYWTKKTQKDATNNLLYFTTPVRNENFQIISAQKKNQNGGIIVSETFSYHENLLDTNITTYENGSSMLCYTYNEKDSLVEYVIYNDDIPISSSKYTYETVDEHTFITHESVFLKDTTPIQITHAKWIPSDRRREWESIQFEEIGGKRIESNYKVVSVANEDGTKISTEQIQPNGEKRISITYLELDEMGNFTKKEVKENGITRMVTLREYEYY